MSPAARLRTGLVFLAVVTLVGTLGYIAIEGVSFVDALYMVAITVTTVGFSEVFPLHPAGRLFTLGLLAVGVGAALYTAGASIEYLIVLGRRRREARIVREIERLRDHVVICGFGRVGRGVWDNLEAREVPTVVIDSDADRIEAARALGALGVVGDATQNRVLSAAGIEGAKALVACVANDSDNLVIVLSAKAMCSDLLVVSRANALESQAKLRLAGADRVVAPQVVGSERLAAMAVQPELTEFIDVVLAGRAVEFVLEEIPVGNESTVVGRSLRESGIREQTGALVLAVEEGDRLLLNPEAGMTIRSGQVLVAVGTRRQVEQATTLLRP